MSNMFFNPVISKRNFDKMFGEFPHEFNRYCGTHPKVDIVENDNSFELYAELPGMNKDDVKIVVEDGILTISGEKKNNIAEDEKNVITRHERSFGKFERRFKLTEDINPEEIKALFENGLLQVSFAKIVPQEPEERIIEVK